jgi:uncharacterized protein (TIGR02391 family)
MPSPTGPRGSRLLNAIWSWFKKNDEWPTFDEIDRELYRSEHDGSFVEAAFAEIPEGLVWGVDLRRPTQASPTVANCEDAGAEINALLGLVRVAANVERDWEPPKTQDMPSLPSLDPEALRGLASFDPNTLPPAQILYRAAQLAMNEPWSSGLGRDLEKLYWKLSFDRRIRPFAGVRDLADYWERRIRVMAPASTEWHRPNVIAVAGTATAQGAALAPTVEIAGTAASMLASLHPDVEAKAGELFRDGYVKQAVFEMGKHLEHRVQTLAGPMLQPMTSGKPLMGKVFAASAPLLDPTRAVDEYTRRDEQEGFSHLFMGMMQAIRNTGGHGDYPVYSEEEAFEILAFLSYLSRRLDLAGKRLQADGDPEDSSGS